MKIYSWVTDEYSSSFEEFLSCLKTQVGTPFLMRYLRRDDTALKITACREQIIFALNQFQVRLSTALALYILIYAS